jgi:hypothetical protein
MHLDSLVDGILLVVRIKMDRNLAPFAVWPILIEWENCGRNLVWTSPLFAITTSGALLSSDCR